MAAEPFPSPLPPAGGEPAIPGPNFVYRAGPNLYVNLTSRCTADCEFCLRNFTWDVFGYDLRLRTDEEPDAGQVTEALERAWLDVAPSEVVFTGLGEPTLRLDVMLEVLGWLRTRRLRTRLDTNGHGDLVNPGRDVVAELKAAGLTAVSVSLNAADEATYDQLCRPTFAKAYRAVLSFIRRSVDAGLDVTVTVVDVAEVDLDATAAAAHDLGARLRVRRLVKEGEASS
jgi:GTP 3',8-cyclase